MIKKLVLLGMCLFLFPLNIFAEENSNEDVNAKLEKKTYDSNNFLPDWLDSLYEEKAQPNKMLDQTFQDFKTIITDYEMRSKNNFEEEGTTLEEFLDGFESDVEPSKQEVDDNITVLYYQYKDTEPSETLPLEEWAELLVFFENNRLTHVGIGTLSFAIDDQALTTSEDYSQFRTAEDLLTMQGQIYGLSVSNINGYPVYSILVPTGKDVTDAKGSFTVIFEEEIVSIYEQNVMEVMNNGPNYYFEATILEALDPSIKILPNNLN